MATFRPREEIYKKDNAVLTVGIDNNGNLYSSIRKDGKVVAKDFLMKMPFEVQLAEKGWTRIKDINE